MPHGAALLHCVRFLVGVEEGETQTTAAERAAIARHASGARRAAEIGVYEGVTTSLIAGAMAGDGILYAVDPFFAGRLGIRYGKIITEVALRRSGVRRKVRLVQRLSANAAPLVAEPLDFVFIDADHRYEAMARDWLDWSAKLSIGGSIALHDTQAPAHDPAVGGYGSARYFREAIVRDPRFRLAESVDSLNVLRRVA
jgi:predicted O-methyltransferase YrrM